MESLRHQLFVSKSIPYISKKQVNDELAAVVLRRMNSAFYQRIYGQIVATLHHFHVLKGGAAVAAHLDKQRSHLADLDMEMYIECGDDDDDVTLENLPQHVAIDVLKRNLYATVVAEHRHRIKQELANVKMSALAAASHSPLVIFKSYVDEAVEVIPKDCTFELNPRYPFKMTTSRVNDDYFLVRYSFNVHMVSESAIWLHKSDNTVDCYTYFPFDLYFLDVVIKPKRPLDIAAYSVKRLFDCTVFVEEMQYTICDQLESIMFNVFHRQTNKMETRVRTLQQLLEHFSEPMPTQNELRQYRAIREDNTLLFSVREIKKLLYATGPRLGADLLVYLYSNNRLICNNIEHVTYQINFPYHKLDSEYYINSWCAFVGILNSILNLGYFFDDINKKFIL